MREYASPVSSPPFKYTTDDFWVEIDHHRHRRCDPTRLYKLLTYVDPGPAYTKKGTLRVHQPVPHKDETESFYIAQLLHYGLKHLKSKQAAKKALLAAYENQGSNLTVPDNVYKIERDLSTEYRLKNEAANKEHDQQKLLREAAAAEERKKRKREDDEMLSEFLSEVQEQVSPTSARPQKKPRSSKVSSVFSNSLSMNSCCIAAIATFGHTQTCWLVRRCRTRSLWRMGLPGAFDT